ncbi:UNVERIFIED_CONTAM: Zinc finger BED domain-containing protein RICESLEEPER 1 [Sesamum radiatum]|uniref:Zinc finger BED domain-containing protein RICESLEEPER 1 n=1 Tax=Sesamum radiatum TaxID=300843 RepID=A0AAW2S104_SESRA
MRHLLVELWTTEGLSIVASGIGKPLYQDAITRACTILDFACVCVMLDISSKLPKHVIIMILKEDDSETACKVDIEYEWLCPKYNTCVSLGHAMKACPMTKPLKPVISVYVQKAEIVRLKSLEPEPVPRQPKIPVLEPEVRGPSSGRNNKVVLSTPFLLNPLHPTAPLPHQVHYQSAQFFRQDSQDICCLLDIVIWKESWIQKEEALKFRVTKASEVSLLEKLLICYGCLDVSCLPFILFMKLPPSFLMSTSRSESSQPTSLHSSGHSGDNEEVTTQSRSSKRKQSVVWEHFTKDGLNEVRGLIDKIRGTVRYLNKSPAAAQKFEMALNQCNLADKRKVAMDVPNRWNSTYELLATALPLKEAFTRLQRIDKNYYGNPSESEWEVAGVVHECLKIFYEATRHFSGRKYPTSNVFFSDVCEIHLKMIEWENSDFDYVRRMVSRMKQKFDKYWDECCLVLGVAVVFDPRFKMDLVEYFYSRIYSTDAHSYIQRVRDKLVSMFIDYGGSCAVSVNDPNVMGSSGVETRASLRDFDRWCYESRVSNNQKSELESYLEEARFPRAETFNILDWWKTNSPRLPVLAKIARDILAVQPLPLHQSGVMKAQLLQTIVEERSGLGPGYSYPNDRPTVAMKACPMTKPLKPVISVYVQKAKIVRLKPLELEPVTRQPQIPVPEPENLHQGVLSTAIPDMNLMISAAISNVWGLNRRDHQISTTDLVSEHGLHFIGLLKTRVSSHNAACVQMAVLPRWKWYTDYNGPRNRIWLAWDDAFLEEANDAVVLQVLWHNIGWLARAVGETPWIVGGDFNTMLDMSEVCGVSGDIKGAADDFQDYLNDTGFITSPMQGEWFTWHNCCTDGRSL